MYPQTVVPLGELHDILTAGTDGTNLVTATGASYTANKDGTRWNPTKLDTTQELNYEYSYFGERYVKVTPYANGTNTTTYVYNNSGGAIGREGIRWFKVEPIKWIILNFNQLIVKNADDIVTDLPRLNTDIPMELFAADVLISGVAPGSSSWNISAINQYLNGVFYDQAFSPDEANLIQQSTIYNNNSDGTEFNTASYRLNANHLTDGSGMNPTDQYLYLLSRYELENSLSPYVTTNPIFTSNDNHKVSGTDYARAHCLYLYGNGANYWLRSANSGSDVYLVHYSGGISSGNALSAFYGTRPA